jgi:hypothetical protein
MYSNVSVINKISNALTITYQYAFAFVGVSIPAQREPFRLGAARSAARRAAPCREPA